MQFHSNELPFNLMTKFYRLPGADGLRGPKGIDGIKVN